MERLTLRIKPKEVDSYISTLSRFGWRVISKVEIYGRKVDLGPYTPLNYDKKYKGRLFLVNFERDKKSENYKELVEAEKDYLSNKLHATSRVKPTFLITSLVFFILALLAALIITGLTILGAMGLRVLVINFGVQLNGFIDFLNGLLRFMVEGLANIGILIDPTLVKLNPDTVGTIAGIISLFVLSIPLYISNAFLFIIPSIVFFIVGLVQLLLQSEKSIKTNKKNKVKSKTHKEIFAKLNSDNQK